MWYRYAVHAKSFSAKVVGDLAFCSGHGCFKQLGRVGKDVTLEQGYEAARRCGANCLFGLKTVIGSLDRIDEIVKLKP